MGRRVSIRGGRRGRCIDAWKGMRCEKKEEMNGVYVVVFAREK
jgi:hypothetical protein